MGKLFIGMCFCTPYSHLIIISYIYFCLCPYPWLL